MKQERGRIYSTSSVECEGVTRYTVEVKTPYGGTVTVVVEEDVYVALDELQRDLWSGNRKEDRHTSSLDAIPTSAIPPRMFSKSAEQVVMDGISRRELESALLRISDVQRRRFLLKHLQGLTAREIARIEGCSEQAVGHSLALARKNLQKILSEEV